VTLVHHLKGGERLLGLIVIIQMPGKIRDGEQPDRQGYHAPKRGTSV
jgi:hypothetical protein